MISKIGPQTGTQWPYKGQEPHIHGDSLMSAPCLENR